MSVVDRTAAAHATDSRALPSPGRVRSMPAGPVASWRPADLDHRALVSLRIRHRGRRVATFALALVAALLMNVLLPSRYTAEARMLVRQHGDVGFNVGSVLSGLPTEAALETEIQMLRSPELALEIIEELDLFAGLTRTPEQRSEVLDGFSRRLTVEPIGLSRVISVRYEDADPSTAAAVSNAVVQGYIDVQRANKAEAASVAADWLNQRIESLSRQARIADLAVERFRRESGLLETRGLVVTSQQVAQLSSQLSAASAEREGTEARLALITERIESGEERDSLPLQSRLLDRLRLTLAANMREIAESEEEFGPLHPRLINLRSRNEDIDDQIAAEQQRLVGEIAAEVKVARTREASLRDSIFKLTDQLAELNTQEVRLRSLEREAEAASALLEDLLGRAKEAGSRTDARMQTVDASFVAHADVPVEASFPPRTSLVVVALFLASIIGVGWALVADNLSSGFLDEREIRRLSGLPCLGRVPRVRASLRAEFTDLFSQRGPLPHRAYVDKHPASAFAESVRLVHSNATLKPGLGVATKSLLVSSATRREGVSTLVASLAVVQAQAGMRVLVIDANLRAPRMAATFGGSARAHQLRPGLTAVLAGEIELHECVTSAFSGRVHVLGADAPAHGPGNALFASPAWPLLVERATSHYDLVLVDAPAMSVSTETQLLCRGVASTVFVTQWATAPRAALLESLERLHAADGAVAGIVLQLSDRAGQAYASQPLYGE